MKNIFKKTLCALTLAVVCMTSSLAFTQSASASGHDIQDMYISDYNEIILRDQPSYNSPVTFFAEGSRYELHVMEYQNGFGYCYVPYFNVNGWIDLSDAHYMNTIQFKKDYGYMEVYDTYGNVIAVMLA